MNYEIRLHPKAKIDLFELDKEVQTSVLKQIVKLETAPELGELLGNKNGINLSGLRKLYAAKKQIRIIYEIVADEIVADEIVVHVIAIGKREEMEAYKEALKRIEKPVI